ncbi:hypothetical protein TWF225_006324 [Orbilia oligospora]|uniref:Uncharacterized protein n=1 Tax=Orbilia oligospora TaxID=2813651 RepID=A0A7C8PHG0_ORBOL|nr:hypothetical protein TWF751_007837 [Orbilia oligospora]KAF3183181.1 hypothetical protein TWF225_006324 [Orbilia oligospora]KAF3238875.1 hypothetical protein TWF128_011942 [Orbilia oligospora]KAF3251181.1 hypothetical protein TWF217_008105 [Orbilia oligospora]KAF3285164.1 hypothetical protein TWF132_009557 [Orbilia oligospora]
MRDDDTASIWSNAPSYRSTIDPPPYTADGGLPSYSSSSSLPETHSSRTPIGSIGSSTVSRGLPPIPPSRSGLPPIAFITPGSRGQQSRQYQAVAARRQAKQVSKGLYNPNFSSRIFPRDNPIRQNAPGLTYDTYNSLHPVLSARNSPHALSTAELFLCTCGRHNGGNTSDLENANHVIDPRAPRPLHNPIFDEPCPSTLRPPVSRQTPVAKVEEKKDLQEETKKVNPTGEFSDKALNDGDVEESKDEEDIDTEGKSWDFMMSQM